MDFCILLDKAGKENGCDGCVFSKGNNMNFNKYDVISIFENCGKREMSL